MPAQWIDFKQLRKQLSFVEIAKLYHMDLKIKGDRAMALCPLPGHRERNDGSKRTASLSINLSRNLFNCFGCKASGNALDFVIFCEGGDPKDAVAVRKAALKLVEQLGLKLSDDTNRTGATEKRWICDDDLIEQKQKEQVSLPRAPVGTKVLGRTASAQVCKEDSNKLPEIVNPILDFELKNLDRNHVYLRDRGFTRETVEHFGLGFCNRGLMKDRIAIPLHDEKSRLVGYAGRLIDDTQVRDEQPKYRFPGERLTKDAKLVFAKSELLYNAHRVNLTTDIIVVEGFASVWWLTQQGYPDVVAVMGSSISSTQVQLILNRVRSHGRVWVFTDEDPAGESLACDVLYSLSSRRWCRWVRGEAGTQPTDWTADELSVAFDAIDQPIGRRLDSGQSQCQ